MGYAVAIAQPRWSNSDIDGITYEQFRKRFIDERKRGLQVKRMESMSAKGYATLAHWDENKRKLFVDFKRVARLLNNPEVWEAVSQGAAVASSDSEFVKEELQKLSTSPLGPYFLLFDVAYSYMVGDLGDYFRLPHYMRELWDRKQFQDMMRWAM